MRIKNALSRTSRGSIFIVASIAIVTGILNLEIRKEAGHLSMARSMRAAIWQRSASGVEFYIHGDDQALVQARLKTEQLTSLIRQAVENFGEAEDTSVLSEMASINAGYTELFEKFISSYSARVGTEPGVVKHPYEEMALFSQVQLKSHALQDLAASMETWHIRRVDRLNSLTTLLFSVSLGILIVFTIASGRWISKKLSESEEEIRRINAGLEERIAVRTAQLETANKELEAFTYSVAHDLRAPLRSIDGFAKILGDEYETVLDGEARRLIEIIRGSSRKMDSMIQSLLDLTRTGKSEICPANLDMRRLATEAFSLCADPATLAGFEFEAGALPDAYADQSLMERVWLNLLSNAVKYSARGPARRIEVRGMVKDGMNVYSVRDHGAGFNQRYAGKLFGMFHRLHDEREFSGSGIGLTIVKKIVERHGGTVWAEGREGEGATFTFSIPERS